MSSQEFRTSPISISSDIGSPTDNTAICISSSPGNNRLSGSPASLFPQSAIPSYRFANGHPSDDIYMELATLRQANAALKTENTSLRGQVSGLLCVYSL